MNLLQRVFHFMNYDIEVWKPVVGYENCYQVSNLGNVRSITRRVYQINKSPKISYGRILKPSKSRGYFGVTLCRDEGKKKRIPTHRLVAIAFLSNPQNKSTVNHINGNKEDNRLQNLEWATVSENTQHAYNNGLVIAAKGEKHGMVKLTENQVHLIRQKLLVGEKQKDICREFGISRTAVSGISTGRNWSWL